MGGRGKAIEHQHVRVAARIALYADRFDGQNPTFVRALDRRIVGRTEAANGQARTGEWMAVEEFRRQAQLAADGADFVLIERAQRLHNLAALDQFLDAGHPIVVGFDDGGVRGAAGFDGVGIDSALPQNPVAVEQMALPDDAVLHGDESFADDLALLLWLMGPGQGADELGLRVFDADGVVFERCEHGPHHVGFAGAH